MKEKEKYRKMDTRNEDFRVQERKRIKPNEYENRAKSPIREKIKRKYKKKGEKKTHETKIF